MLNNYLKTAFRSLMYNKSNTVINVTGLSIGISVCILLFVIIRFEKSFDTFHKNKDRIFRIVSTLHTTNGIIYSSSIPFPLAEALRIDYPQLDKVANILSTEGQVTLTEGKNAGEKFEENKGVFYSEPQFFDIFSFGWLAGTSKTALTDPNSVVLTKEIAEKYFGDWQNAFGKTIKLDNQYIYKVTGILKNVPENSDFPLKIILSYSSLKQTGISVSLNSWKSSTTSIQCYVLLSPELTKENFESLLQSFNGKHKFTAGTNKSYIVEPLSDLHFDSRFSNFNNQTFSRELITALTLIGVFILIIACVNFINLSTAKAVNRSREVGIRKTLGSYRSQLILQFMSETFLVTLSAVILAFGISEILLKYLNQLLKVNLTINLFNDHVMIIFLIVLTVLITFLSGFYPSMIISGFSPVSALKSKITVKTAGGVTLRRGLVLLQFIVAQVMLICMLVVVSQMNFLKNAPLGFDKDSIMTISLPNDNISVARAESFKNQLLSNTGVRNVSVSSYSPMDDSHWTRNFHFDNSLRKTDFEADFKWADTDYFKTYNIKFIAGRAYQESDSVKEVVVSEELVKKLGITNPVDILGKRINLWDGQIVAPIVGVIEDFHSRSLQDVISPVLMGSWKAVYGKMNLKISTADLTVTIDSIKRIWDSVYPDYVFQYEFLDEKIESFYASETMLSVLYTISSGIAMFISCLGLYGLISFMTLQRTKEIGIRKVLGASVGNILYLISKEFTVLIIVAFVVAAPIAHYLMRDWLNNYAYRISISVGIFLLAIISSIVVAWLTVGYRSIKAANSDPIKSLRYE